MSGSMLTKEERRESSLQSANVADEHSERVQSISWSKLVESMKSQ